MFASICVFMYKYVKKSSFDMNLTVIYYLCFAILLCIVNPAPILADMQQTTQINPENLLKLSEADEDLQEEPATSVHRTLANFFLKGGHFVRLDNETGHRFTFLPDDSVYPICSAGRFRSQTLRVLLKKYQHALIVFPPHGARYTFDPYNGKINWHRKEALKPFPDMYHEWSGEPKPLRYGFDIWGVYHPQQEVPPEILDQMKEYFTKSFYGPESSLDGKQGARRVYITFDKNAHAVMHRLLESNDKLDNVYVLHIPLKDLVSNPLPEWNTNSYSVRAYEEFAFLISDFFDFTEL